MATRWRVLLVTQHKECVRPIEQALDSAQHQVVATLFPEDDLVVSARRAQPDVVVVEVAELSPSLLAQIRRLMEEQPLPVAVFVGSSSTDEVRMAVKAGVSACVVDGLKTERVLPELEAATARFVELEGLRAQRDEAVAKLAERRDIERAKGILMRRRDLAEQVAYDTLRKMAMDRGARMIEVAKNIITAEEVLARG